jgi:hypothetical protein
MADEPRSPGRPESWVRKPGNGRSIEDGDRLRLHARVALAEDDFDFEERLLCSTYEPPKRIDLAMSRSLLLREVYDALIGQRAGSTLVVRIDTEVHGLGGKTPIPEVSEVLLEIWVEAGEPAGEDDLAAIEVGRRHVVVPISAETRLLELWPAGRAQANGFYVEIPNELEDLLLEIIAQLRGEDTSLSEPHRPGVVSSEIAGYLLDDELYRRIARRLRGIDEA